MAQGLQAHTTTLKFDELQQRKEQRGLSYVEKMRCYDLQPSNSLVLDTMKNDSLWKALDDTWNDAGYLSPDSVGSLLTHLRKTKPVFRHDWLDLMFEEYPYASFMALANRIVHENKRPITMPNALITPQLALDGLTIRVVINTWTGYEGERDTLDMLNKRIADGLAKNHNGVRYATPYEDKMFAIDIVLTMDAVPVFGIQVKPASYLTNRSKLDTKIKNKKNNLDWQKLTKGTVFYVNTADIREGNLKPISLSELDRRFGI